MSIALEKADLDGNLLIRDDPYSGVTLEGPEKYVCLPEGRPGIGVVPRAA